VSNSLPAFSQSSLAGKRRQILIGIFVIVLAIVGVIIATKPQDYSNSRPGPEKSIVVANGEIGSAIATDLEKQGVVKKASVFVAKLTASQLGRGIAPGVHRIQTHISSTLALTQLLDQKRIADSLVVKEGSTLSDVLKSLHSNVSLVQSDGIPSLKPPIANPAHSLEGQLFPLRYSFAPQTTTHDALDQMLGHFVINAKSTGLLGGYDKYTAYQVLTIASMVQIEGDPTNFSKVSRVIYNRLKLGMPLQLNSTVQYAANLRGRIGLSNKATQIRSPYNTYIHIGLPPTPISNPGADAIAASLKPSDGNWLYFITVKPHDTRFTNDFALFQTWNTLYNNNVASGAFK